MSEIFMDALIDGLKMVPFLFVIYIGIELLEYKLGDQLIGKVKKSGKIAPAAGAAFGLVPQCGFSVMATALYSKRVITLGTLMAVYLSTSDEALPIILSQHSKISLIIPLLLAKLVIALTVGYSLDLLFSRKKESLIESEICATRDDSEINAGKIIDETGCCGHECPAQKLNLKEIIYHPLKHTVTVFIFVFLASFLINYIIFQVGENNLSKVFMANSIFQPIITAFFGLIPNCASSVAITEIFLKGGISFGSAVAGLCSGAGLGLLVLFKENESFTDSLKIVGLLVAVSSAAGIITQLLIG